MVRAEFSASFLITGPLYTTAFQLLPLPRVPTALLVQMETSPLEADTLSEPNKTPASFYSITKTFVT